ncbi:MAG: family 1 encapsulin nanocompartment shell protein, partial [Isosphaeraceae bacterium]
DLPAVVTAAEKAAHAEDTAIFNGFKAGDIEGIIPSSPHPAIAIPDDYADYPSVVGSAVETLRRAGINGPYALALGPDCYAGLAQAAEDGYPIRERVEHFLDGPMVLAPTIDGALLLSHRGGDYQFSVGQDMSVGYAGHGKDEVHLYLTESFAFRVLDRAAAVYLKPKREKK